MIYSVSYDDTIKVWTCEDEDGNDEWNCIQTLSGPNAHRSTVWDLTFNPEGTLFCSGILSFAFSPFFFESETVTFILFFIH